LGRGASTIIRDALFHRALQVTVEDGIIGAVLDDGAA
jgi:hypothetical protein